VVDPVEVAMLVIAGLVVLLLAIFLIPKEIRAGAPAAVAEPAIQAPTASAAG
jgi:hypothetical protein